jgi:hypothetical protein
MGSSSLVIVLCLAGAAVVLLVIILLVIYKLKYDRLKVGPDFKGKVQPQRGGQEGYLAFLLKRRCFLHTLRGLLSCYKFQKNRLHRLWPKKVFRYGRSPQGGARKQKRIFFAN